MGWKRDTGQERGNVLRWFERGATTASVVKGDIPGEAEVRVSGRFGSVKFRGSRDRIMTMPEKRLIRDIETVMRRETKMLIRPPRLRRIP